MLDRLAWVDLDNLSKQQAELARQYLRRRDYVRAALFAWETLVSKECEKNELDPEDRDNRKNQNVLRAVDAHKRKACENLNQIRNALAHGSLPNSKGVREILMNEQKLHEALQQAFNSLLPSWD